MLKASPEQIHAANTNANAFMTLSEITFSGIERLTKLNLNATRAALEGGLEATAKLGQSKDMKAAPVVQETTAYLQEVQKIVTETQQEVTKLMTSYFSAKGQTANPGADWLKGFEMFKGFGTQIASMAEANQKMLAEGVKKTVAAASKKD